MSFVSLGLVPSLVEALASGGIHEPTPVQRLTIPALLGGRSVLAVAQTGSGKTVAYGAPLLQRLRAVEDAEGAVTVRARPRAIVLTGTRELVEQTMRDLKGLAHGVRQRVRGVSGGMTDRQVGDRLRDPVDLLVSNPPRLRALAEAGTVDLSDVRALVLDEGDTLCAPGQRGDVEAILRRLPKAQLALVSATLPEAIRHWATTLPQAPTLLLAKDAHAPPARVRIHNHPVLPIERPDVAHDILVTLPAEARGILFANRRETADEAGRALAERGNALVVLHGGQLPGARREHIARFRRGEVRLLVTTELGGRGLHIEGLAFVINWELPEKPSEYLHRIGRVGRQGARGEVHNLVTTADHGMLREVTRLAKGGKLDTGERVRAPRAREPQAQAKAARVARRRPPGRGKRG